MLCYHSPKSNYDCLVSDGSLQEVKFLNFLNEKGKTLHVGSTNGQESTADLAPGSHDSFSPCAAEPSKSSLFLNTAFASRLLKIDES